MATLMHPSRSALIMPQLLGKHVKNKLLNGDLVNSPEAKADAGAATMAMESEMNKNIVGDDDVQAFKYFLMGNPKKPQANGDSPMGINQEREIQVRQSGAANSELSNKNDSISPPPIGDVTDRNKQSPTAKSQRKLTQFYYKLKNLNDKIQLFTQLFYNKAPKYE